MNNTESIMISGQGGQGVLKAAKMLADYYFLSGKDVKASTLIGLGVRGGGVYSHVKAGGRIISPLIMAGRCDMIIGLEKLETVRCLDYLKANGELIVNDLYLPPTTVSNGLEDDFAGDFESIFKQKTKNCYLIQGEQIAGKMRNGQILNSFFLGIASTILGHDRNIWKKVLESNLPREYVKLNIDAFFMGIKYS